MQKILKTKIKPTTILAAHGSLAIGAMNAIKENRLNTPKDIAVIGFDDTLESLMVNPKLSTIRFPLYELGEVSTKMLVKIIKVKKIRLRDSRLYQVS